MVATIAPNAKRTKAGVHALEQCGRFLAAGCIDGVVNLYDQKMRSSKVVHTFPGTDGPWRQMEQAYLLSSACPS